RRLAGWNEPISIGQERPAVDLRWAYASINGNDNWRQKVWQSLSRHFGKVPNRQRLPLFKTGSIASSNHLVRNPAVLIQWLSSHRQILAVEMETAGVYEAAQMLGHQYPVIAI